MTPDQSKVCSPAEAVAAHVHPGDHLHLVTAGGRPNALIRALLAHFWDQPTEARLTVSGTSLGGTQLGLALLERNMVARAITGYVGHQYPAPGPALVAREALAGGTAFEMWSLLTLLQRLRAGAMGLEWTTTKSIAGGSLSAIEANVRRLTVDGDDVTLIPALRPDIALVHAIIADDAGNALLPAPYGESTLGALAATRGVLVTAEKVVSAEEFRRYPRVPSLPANVVLSVSAARFGAHPSSLYADGVDTSLTYRDDYEFLTALRTALESDPAERERWLRANLALPVDPDAYIEQLGDRRIHELQHEWRTPLTPPTVPNTTPMTREERMIIAAASVIAERVEQAQPAFVFAGIGASSLATWLARTRIPEFPPLISEMGFFDYTPQTGDPWLFATANMVESAVLSDTDTILGSLVQGHAKDGIGVLATAQIDRHGNLNTTEAGGRFITGSGGANDVTSAIGEVIVVVPHHATRLPADVDYITSPGSPVTTIVTDRAVFTRAATTFALHAIVTAYDIEPNIDATVKEVLSVTPWVTEVSPALRIIEIDTDDALLTLRHYDPERHFLGTSETPTPARKKATVS